MSQRDEINLRVLQHQDPTVESIYKQSPYVVLYSYSMADSSWSKLPFEGTLFVYRTKQGAYGYRILNRLSLECFTQLLTSEEDVMETEGYVIHRAGEEIWGIWIWDGDDRSNIYLAMKEAAKLNALQTPQSSAHTLAFEGASTSQSMTASTGADSWTPSSIKS